MGVFLEGASGEPAPEPEPAAAGANSVLRGPHGAGPGSARSPKPAGCLPGTGSERSLDGLPLGLASTREACRLNPRFATRRRFAVFAPARFLARTAIF